MLLQKTNGLLLSDSLCSKEGNILFKSLEPQNMKYSNSVRFQNLNILHVGLNMCKIQISVRSEEPVLVWKQPKVQVSRRVKGEVGM